MLRRGLAAVGAVGLVLLGTPAAPVGATHASNHLSVTPQNGAAGIHRFTPMSRPQFVLPPLQPVLDPNNASMTPACVAYANYNAVHRFTSGTITKGTTSKTVATTTAPVTVTIASGQQLVPAPPDHSGATGATTPFKGAAFVDLRPNMWWEFADGSHGNHRETCNGSGPGADPIGDATPTGSVPTTFQVTVTGGANNPSLGSTSISCLPAQNTSGTYRRGHTGDGNDSTFEFTTDCTQGTATNSYNIVANLRLATVAGISACNSPIMPEACMVDSGEVIFT